MGQKKITVYQKWQVVTLLQVGFTYENIRNQLGVSNGCISNVTKKEKLKLPLKNRPGQGRKKSTTSNEDRYLMKKDREKSSRQLASEWNLSNGKSISYVDAYLMLVIEAIRRDENRIGNVIIVLFDYDSLNSVLIGILVTGKMLFFLTKPISKFLIEKIDLSYVVFHQNLMHHLTLNHVFKVVVDQLAYGEL